MATLKQGDRVSNYLLEERVGQGSFGQVWRAKHHVFHDTVAIKIPTDPQYVRNIQREGVAIHGLKHPNIVRAIDLDPYAEPPYLIMEFVDGPSLREVIDQYEHQFPIGAAIEIMRGVLHALSAAHRQNLIHRDIKPANILLTHPADKLASITASCVKVTDFGLGIVGQSTSQSIMQSASLDTPDGQGLAGTLAYMSPEQKNGQPADTRCDLYACGIVLYEMLTGGRPTGGDLPTSVRQDVPKFLDGVFQQCYTRIDRRFESAQDMLAALNPGDASSPPPLPTGQQAGQQAVEKCPACSARIDRNDQFCIHCGEQLIASVPRCTKCQAYVHVNDQFCIMCGHDLGLRASG